MKNTIYFDFTIKGDNLNVLMLYNEVNIKGELYLKGEESIFIPNNEKFIQETNRWVYSAKSIDDDIEKFLEQELKIIEKNLNVLNKYIKENFSLIDYVIYVEEDNTSKVNVTFSKSIIDLLNKIKSEISITFIDW